MQNKPQNKITHLVTSNGTLEPVLSKQNEPQLSAEMENTYIDPTKHGRKDLTGMRFGRLIAVKIVGSAGSHMRWLCECDCGRSKIISSPQLIRGVTRSCGCLQTDTFTTHSLSKHRLYLAWYDMMRRCENTNHKNYCDYGGRGIRVCKIWHDVSNFVKDMDDSYKPGLSIERIDNNDGYKKSNCKWATKKEQQRNRRNSMFYTINGVTKQLCEWIDESNVNKNTVKNRLHRGFSITQALGMEQL